MTRIISWSVLKKMTMHDELGLGEVGEIEMDMQTTVLGDIAMSIGSADLPENFEGKILVSRLNKYFPKMCNQSMVFTY